MDAESRNAVFASLREKGIKAIKVVAADGSKANGEVIVKGIRKRVLFISVAAAALISGFIVFSALRTQNSEPFSLPRRQIYGDAATIEVGVKTHWSSALESKGDRYLAHFVQPGKVEQAPSVTDDELSAALAADLEIIDSDSEEVRQVVRMVNGLKEEARAYVAAGGKIEIYMDRLEERQRMEDAFYTKALNDLKKLEEFAKEQGPKVKESTVQEWNKRNAELRAMGLRTIPLPDSLLGLN